jgi:hypothetical protein
MPGIIDINEEEAGKKLSVFRKYYYEIGIIVLAMVVSYLFIGQKQLERDMRNYLINDRTAAFEKMNATTEVIRQNTEVMKSVTDLLQDQTSSLRRIEQTNQERNLKH